MKKLHERAPVGSLVKCPEEWVSFANACQYWSTDKKTGRALNPQYMLEQIAAGFDPLRYDLGTGGNLLRHIVSSGASAYFHALLPTLGLDAVVLDARQADVILAKAFECSSDKFAEHLLQAGFAGFPATVIAKAKSQSQFDLALDNLKQSEVTAELDNLLLGLLSKYDNVERAKAFLACDFPVEGNSPRITGEILTKVLQWQHDLDIIKTVAERYDLRGYIAQHDGLKSGSPLPAIVDRKDCAEVFDYALSLGLDVNGRDQNGVTGLLNEVSQSIENVAMVQRWIDRGADINAQDENGTSVLHAAVANKRIQSVDLLAKNGVDLMVRNHRRQVAFSGLMPAALYCHHLLGRTIPFGWNLAMVAALASWPEKLREAFNAGDAPDHVSDGGQTILEMMLTQQARDVPPEMFQIMEEAGVDMNALIPFRGPKTKEVAMLHPLHYLLKRADDYKVSSMFIAYLAAGSAEVDCKDDDGQTPLYRAVRLGDRDMVKALLDAGADTGIRCGRLTLKALTKDEKIKEMLLAVTTEQMVAESVDQVTAEAVRPASARSRNALMPL